jgi:hypothetical protein
MPAGYKPASSGRMESPAQMRIWSRREVPGKALPGEEARRRAVEGPTKAGVPGTTRVVSRAATDSHPRSSPATAGHGPEHRLPADISAWPVSLIEMEVIRDQF